MKNLISLFAVGISFFMFNSCEKVLPLDTDTKTSKLVVNSLFSSDNEWRIELTRSLSVLDDGILHQFIDNAKVNILDENNNLIEQLAYNFGYYESVMGLKPVAGSKYKVEVSAPNYTSVKSEDVCPTSVSILNVDTSSRANNFGEKTFSTTLKFQDPANTENFYGIELEIEMYRRVFNSTSGDWDTIIDGASSAYLTSGDPSVSEEGTEDYLERLIFKDNLFDGQQKSITFEYDIYLPSGPDHFFIRSLKLVSLTKTTYNYLKSIEAYNRVVGNPFAEPVQVFSNVENGFGIFGGLSRYEYRY